MSVKRAESLPKRRATREQRLGHLNPDERAVLLLLGRQVRALRLQRHAEALAVGQPKVTIDALAAKAGINASVLGEIERGRVNLSLMVLTRLARALNVGLPVLFQADEGQG
ncbi:MAG: helix-turn-helix transcriptional regulator [Gemmatimonadota bacterium]